MHCSQGWEKQECSNNCLSRRDGIIHRPATIDTGIKLKLHGKKESLASSCQRSPSTTTSFSSGVSESLFHSVCMRRLTPEPAEAREASLCCLSLSLSFSLFCALAEKLSILDLHTTFITYVNKGSVIPLFRSYYLI